MTSERKPELVAIPAIPAARGAGKRPVSSCPFPRLFQLAAACLAILAAGCRHDNNSSPRPEVPLVDTIRSGPVELTILADPPQVHLDRDTLLTIRVHAPSNTEVHLPPLEDKLKGFALSGSFTRDVLDEKKSPAREYCSRLTPTLADEYRIAPMAVTWTASARAGGGSQTEGWFATRPITFQVAGISKGPPGTAIHETDGPITIYPPFKTVAGWALAAAAAAAALYLLWRLSRRVQRAIRLRRMSPRERALYELGELLAQDLVARDKIKEFYLELTMIVRRYIERAHAIRAPEQTTEEFLVAVTLNHDFKREVVRKLQTFLQTADLVKFAAYRPAREIIDQTLATARDYIDTDEKNKLEEKENEQR